MEPLTAEARLRAALLQCLVGGNHIASALIVGGVDPARIADHDAAFDALWDIGSEWYEMWCCWRALIDARNAVTDLLEVVEVAAGG